METNDLTDNIAVLERQLTTYTKIFCPDETVYWINTTVNAYKDGDKTARLIAYHLLTNEINKIKGLMNTAKSALDNLETLKKSISISERKDGKGND